MWPFSTYRYPELEPQEVGVRLSSRSKLPYDGDKDSSSFSSFDYIIVGGGTAGCVLASRLSEIENATVLLLERGSVQDNLLGRIPLASGDIFKEDAPIQIWDAEINPELNDGKCARVIAGGSLGGASRINAMAYVRGTSADYDYWRDIGHPSWSYDTLLPYFVKSETSINQPPSYFRGNTGFWMTQNFHGRIPFTCVRIIQDISPELGIPVVPDMSSPDVQPNFCGDMEFTVDKGMTRCSTYHAFLSKRIALERRHRLKICTNAIASRLDLKRDTEGCLKACGVFFQSRGADARADTFYATAKRETILCGGTLGSPHLLLLSGVGPAQHLSDVGIDVVHDLPGVGSHLQEHISVPLQYRVPLNDSLHSINYDSAQRLFVKLYVLFRLTWEVMIYFLFGRGFLSGGFCYVAIFARSTLLSNDGEVLPDVDDFKREPSENMPDIQLWSLGSAGEYPIPDINCGIYSFLVTLLKPKSTGHVRLASKDPLVRPNCNLGHLTTPEDYIPLRKGIRLAYRFVEKMSTRGYSIEPLKVPKSDHDEAIDDFIRGNSKTAYHYTGTCRMGRLNEARPGVVDDELKVHGIDGLRVCDASVFPEIISAPTMAATVVVAEKCADLIKEKYVKEK